MVLSFWGAVAHKSDIPLWKLPREITHYIDGQREVKNWGDFFALDRQRLTVKEMIRELFMNRNSEEEPDESDDDSDSSFVPETVPEEEKRVSDGGERR